MVQLLPVNDTSVDMSWRDSYPYSSVSVRLPCCIWPLLPCACSTSAFVFALCCSLPWLMLERHAAVVHKCFYSAIQ